MDFARCYWIIFWCPEEGEQEKENAQHFPCERLRAMLTGRDSSLAAYEEIIETIKMRAVKSTGFGVQKRVSRKKKMRRHFPCERLRAALEGRNSPLVAYGAIFESVTRRVIKRTGFGAQKRT